MGLGEKDGEDFDQVKVALVPVFELHVPNEFGLGGHVLVRDHAAVPPRVELHADLPSDEMVRVRGRTWGEILDTLPPISHHRNPLRPMGREGSTVIPPPHPPLPPG